MGFLTRDQVLIAKPPQEVVVVPELGGEVIVRGLSGVERDEFEARSVVGKGKQRTVNTHNFRARLVAYCCVDDKGQRVFSDEDVDALGLVRGDVVDRLFSVAQRLSGLRGEDAEELGLASGSSTPSGSSSSASPSSSR